MKITSMFIMKSTKKKNQITVKIIQNAKVQTFTKANLRKKKSKSNQPSIFLPLSSTMPSKDSRKTPKKKFSNT